MCLYYIIYFKRVKSAYIFFTISHIFYDILYMYMVMFPFLGQPKKGFTIRLKTATVTKSQMESPGPGYYDVKTTIGSKNHSVQKSIGLRTFNGSIFSAHPGAGNPGPGSYSRDASVRFNKSPSYSIRPKTHIPEFKDQVPGPGHYAVKSSIGKGTGKTISFKCRPQEGTMAWVPGPGSYKTRLAGSKSSPAFTMRPKTENFAAKSDFHTTPGPGTYPVKEYIGKSGPARSIAMRHSRSERSIRDDGPGPGHYAPKRMSHPKTVTMKGSRKLLKMSHEDAPGPGQYTVTPKTSSPAFSIRLKTAIPAEKNENPGPIYNPSVKSTKRSSSAYSIRMKTSTESKYDITPGPGTYHNPNKKFGGKAVSMGLRTKTKSKYDITPGPKYYPSLGKSGPSFTFTGRT